MGIWRHFTTILENLSRNIRAVVNVSYLGPNGPRRKVDNVFYRHLGPSGPKGSRGTGPRATMPGGCVLRAGTGVRAAVLLLSVGCDRLIAKVKIWRS